MGTDFAEPTTAEGTSGTEAQPYTRVLVTSVAAATLGFSLASETPATPDFGQQVVVVTEVGQGAVSDTHLLDGIDAHGELTPGPFRKSDHLLRQLEELSVRRAAMPAEEYRARRQALVAKLAAEHERLADELSTAFRASLPLDADEAAAALANADALLDEVRRTDG